MLIPLIKFLPAYSVLRRLIFVDPQPILFECCIHLERYNLLAN